MAALPADRDVLLEQLRDLLRTQLAAQRDLRECVRRQRDAIRTADVDAITAACEEENALIDRCRADERARAALARRLTATLAPEGAEPLSLREIAARAGEPARSALLELADALRSEALAVRRESSIVRAAGESLSRHLAGIMQTVHGALSSVGVYERRGRIAVGSQMEFSIDLRS